jgi:glucose/arabinose dehydrogenase
LKILLIIGALLLAACSAQEIPPAESPFVTQTVPAATEKQEILPSLTPTAAQTPSASPTIPPTATESVDLSEPQPSPRPELTTLFPDPAAYQWVEAASGFRAPLSINSAGDGSGRLFVVSQHGQIDIVWNGQPLAQPFLDISDRTTPLQGYSERGLLGLAFHPRFAENGYFYVNYTDRSGDTHISRFSVSAQDPNRADPDSEIGLLFVQQPYANHNGGDLAFGPDGYLYIALGDGGSAGDPQGYGQSINTLLGKILRIDVDAALPHAIPPQNPFVGSEGLDEIWAYGLRNPWRIAFDPLTGDLYIADVGQNQVEEVNFQPADSPGGENYGWKYREGAHPYDGEPPANLDLVDPVAEYRHDLGCSVTGGVVYRGGYYPEWQGVYFYGDYCSGRIWGLLRDPDGLWQSSELFSTGFMISSFGQDDAGETYVIDYNQGTVYRLDLR